MLRYLYILICTRLCFCYDYIEENQEPRKRNGNSDIVNAIHEKSRTVQFDVASFLRNSVTKSSKDYEPFDFRNKNRDERIQSDYYYESPLNVNVKKRDEDTNYLNNNADYPKNNPTKDPNPQLFGKIINNENSFERDNKFKNEPNELLANGDLIENQEKNCAFKNMRVPFFSRKPSTAKKQKRKILCTKCAKPYADNVLNPDTKSKMRQFNNKIKRTYKNLCPKCMKKLIKRHELEKPDNIKQIHGSREFYQNVAITKGYQNDKRPINVNLLNDRVKREKNEETERQLKELAEVEKKVDSVQVTTPKFNIVPLSK